VGWNYRVMRHEPDAPDAADGKREVWYAIHEVFYQTDSADDRSVDASETRYTEDPVAVVADDVDEMRWVLEQMLAALDKPILEYRE